MKKQIQYFNNLRATACFLVILTHSSMPAVDASLGIFLALFSLISSPSSELFVTISASLLAPTKQEMFQFYKKRFSKLIGPFLFWSIMVVIFDLLQGEINLNEATTKLILFPFTPVIGVYWFVYAICGLYLVIPIITPWLEKASRKMFLFVIGIWTLTLIFPYLNLMFSKPIYRINGDYYFILNYFGGFIGYLFLGVYLRKHPTKFKSKIKMLLFVSILAILGSTPIIYGALYNREILSISRENLSMTSMLFVTAIFIFYQNFKLPIKIENFFNLVAKYSYGIYLIHIVVIRDMVWKILENNRIPHPIIETPLIAVSSLLICLAIVKILSKVPKSNYIIGV